MIALNSFARKASFSNPKLSAFKPLMFVLIGLLAMYVPSFLDLFNGIWNTNQQAHGPIVFVVAIWFFYFKANQAIKANIQVVSAPNLGWPVLLLGCIVFVIGRSQTLYLFEIGSLILVLLGIMLLFFGKAMAKHFWFAFFFMLFMVPLPASIVEAITQPMKVAVSFTSEHLLYEMGYPVARAGIILLIGQYQLLVADACAGLNSLFTLEALGLLYMNIMRHESPLRNALLAALIIPISFAANVTRVVILALITFHWGDEAGQGFVHEFSGMLLFITALFLIICVDTFLRFFTAYLGKRKARQGVAQ